MVKEAKSGHFCTQPDTLTPRQRSLHLGEPESINSTFLVHLGIALLCLGVPASSVLVALFR